MFSPFRCVYVVNKSHLNYIFGKLNTLDSVRFLLKIIVSIPQIVFRFFFTPYFLLFLFRRAEIKQHKHSSFDILNVEHRYQTVPLFLLTSIYSSKDFTRALESFFIHSIGSDPI